MGISFTGTWAHGDYTPASYLLPAYSKWIQTAEIKSFEVSVFVLLGFVCLFVCFSFGFVYVWFYFVVFFFGVCGCFF